MRRGEAQPTTGFNSGYFGGNGRMVILGGAISFAGMCQAAWSIAESQLQRFGITIGWAIKMPHGFTTRAKLWSVERAKRGDHATMSRKVLAAILAAACATSPAAAQSAPPAPAQQTYVLNGFRLSGVPGVDEDALVAKLKDKAGARITEADMVADTKALSDELKARHIEGQLFTTMAEKNGRVWILFDFKGKDVPNAGLTHVTRRFASQIFVGNTKISDAVLSVATGLKSGDALPDARLDAAELAIEQVYKKAMPGAKQVHVGGRIRTTADGKTTLQWNITEPK